MKPNVLVLDTNVWLDYEMGMRPGHDTAFQLVDFAATRGIRLGIASHSIKDIFYIMGQQLKAMNRESGSMPEEAAALVAQQVSWGVFDHLMELAEFIPVDFSDAWIAGKYRDLHPDYEDDLVVAAAMRVKADYLVTSDARLIRHSPVPTLSPDDALRVLQVE